LVELQNDTLNILSDFYHQTGCLENPICSHAESMWAVVLCVAKWKSFQKILEREKYQKMRYDVKIYA